MEEIWKDIPGYEGRYRVSDQGRVRGVTGRLLVGQAVNSGYRVVHLFSGGRHTRVVALVHRLVAQSFVENPNGAEYVNHLDGRKLNNCSVNLAWCTNSENMIHARDSGLWAPFRHGVVGVHMQTKEVVYFKSQRDAEIALSGTGKQSSAVNHCLSGKKKSAYGYVWGRT